MIKLLTSKVFKVFLAAMTYLGISSLSINSAQAQMASNSQLFFIDAGPTNPSSVMISNGDYQYRYNDSSKNSYQVQAGWSLRLLRQFGSWSLQESLGYTGLQGPSSVSGENLQLNVLGVNTGVLYSGDIFPVKWIIPFAEGGYLLSFYNQTGSSDLQSAQGSAGNWNAGAGLRLWLNQGTFNTEDLMTRYTSIPLYLVIKVEWILPNHQDLDFASTNFLIGPALAL